MCGGGHLAMPGVPYSPPDLYALYARRRARYPVREGHPKEGGEPPGTTTALRSGTRLMAGIEEIVSPSSLSDCFGFTRMSAPKIEFAKVIPSDVTLSYVPPVCLIGSPGPAWSSAPDEKLARRADWLERALKRLRPFTTRMRPSRCRPQRA